MYERDGTAGWVPQTWHATSGPSVRGSTWSTDAVATSDLQANTQPTPRVSIAADWHIPVKGMSR